MRKASELGLIFPFFLLKNVDSLLHTQVFATPEFWIQRPWRLPTALSKLTLGRLTLGVGRESRCGQWGATEGPGGEAEKPAHTCAQERAGSSFGPVLIPPIGVRVEGVASHLSWQVSFSGNQIHTLQGATCSLWPGAGASREPEPTCPAVLAPRTHQHAAVPTGQHAEVRHGVRGREAGGPGFSRGDKCSESLAERSHSVVVLKRKSRGWGL